MEEQYFGYVYKVILRKTKEYYIGIHTKNFKFPNIDKTYLGSGKYWNELIVNNHNKEEFDIECLKWCKTREELNYFEHLFVDKIKNVDSFIYGGKCYNFHKGGSLHSFSKSTRKKMSIKKLGISPINKGKKMSIEDKKKVSYFTKQAMRKPGMTEKISNTTKQAMYEPIHRLNYLENFQKYLQKSNNSLSKEKLEELSLLRKQINGHN